MNTSATIPTADLTPASLAVFDRHCRDAGNWSGMPMLDITPAERGNITQLKQAGLIRTHQDEDNPRAHWFAFTEDGIDFAEARGFEIRKYYV